MKGAGALAVTDRTVALFGGYGPDYDRLALTELGAGRAEPAGQYRIVLSDGEPPHSASQIFIHCKPAPTPVSASNGFGRSG